MNFSPKVRTRTLAIEFLVLLSVVMLIGYAGIVLTQYHSQSDSIQQNLNTRAQSMGGLLANISIEPLLSHDFVALNDYLEAVIAQQDVSFVIITGQNKQVLGIHFFSPVPMMAAVEVIKGVATSEETALKGKGFVERIGKEPIMVNRDLAGFVINRINFPSTIEAMNLVESGVASVEDIDKGLRLASGRKMGIFETGDMVGLDVTYGAMMAIYQETGYPRFYPPLLLRRKVKAGHLGKKTGK